MGTPTRFTYGIGTVPKTKVLGDYPLPDPFHTSSSPNMDYQGSGLGVHTYTTDFDSTVAEYTVTGSSSTFALVNGLGGLATITPGAATTATTVSKTEEGFSFVAGQKSWYTTRLEASGVGADSFTFGLDYSTTDGLYFSKAANTPTLELLSLVGGVSTVLSANVGSIIAATFLTAGWYYDGEDLAVCVNGTLVDRILSPTLTTTIMSPFISLTPSASETITIDFILVASEMVR